MNKDESKDSRGMQSPLYLEKKEERIDFETSTIADGIIEVCGSLYGNALREPWQFISIDEIGCDTEIKYTDSDGKEHTVVYDEKSCCDCDAGSKDGKDYTHNDGPFLRVNLKIGDKKYYENYGITHAEPNVVVLPGQKCDLYFYKDTNMIPRDIPKFPTVRCFMRITRYKIIVGGGTEVSLHWDDKPTKEVAEYVHNIKTMTSLLHLITSKDNEQKKLRHRLYDMLKEEFE